MVLPVLLGGIGVGLGVSGYRRVVSVAPTGHLLNLLVVAVVELLDAVLKSQRFGMAPVGFVLALKCADYAVGSACSAKRCFRSSSPTGTAHIRTITNPKC